MTQPHLKHSFRSAAAALLVAGMVVSGLPLPAHAQLPTATPTPQVDPIFATPEPAVAAQPAFVPGQLLVGVRQSGTGGSPDAGATAAYAVTTADAMSAVVAASGAEVAEVLDTTGPGDGQVTYLLQTEPGQEYAVANELLGKPGVVYVEPNWIVTVAQEPVTPVFANGPEQANVSTGFVVDDPLYAANQWNMQRVSASRAWQMVYQQNLFPPARAVTVAVLDTGIDTTQPDFAGRLLPGYNYVGYNNPPMRDGYGHGTHVSGIVAAGLNDSIGVAGIAPNVLIAPYRVLDDNGGGTIANVATGIMSATVDGAQIINMSLTTSSASQTLQDAVEFSAAQGALLLAAAGNAAAGTVYWPAAYPEVVAVAALDFNDHRAAYSNYGPQIEISAPGGDLNNRKILSTWSSEATSKCQSPVISDGAPYCTRSGTSQATPVVAGTAALLWSLDPTLTAAEIRAILRDTADPLTESAQYVGAGKVNVPNALRAILTSDVTIVPTAVLTNVDASTLPITFTVEVQNPSLITLDWSATLNVPAAATVTPTATQGTWITMTSGVDNGQLGVVSYGQPGFITLLIAPSQVISGAYSASLHVTGTRSDGSAVDETLPIHVYVEVNPTGPTAPPTPVAPVPPIGAPLKKTFVPVVFGSGEITDTITADSLRWLEPETETLRTSYSLTDTSAVTVVLPAGIMLGDTAYAAASIFSDGFVALGNSSAELKPIALTDTGSNLCIPSLAFPMQGVFGWWADLDPGAPDARVSSFTSSDGRFVFEFDSVPAVGATQPYSVSFQIVLDHSGGVGLNYSLTPRFVGRPNPVTVGVEGESALFYSLFGCATPSATLGSLPRSGESYLIQAKDIF